MFAKGGLNENDVNGMTFAARKSLFNEINALTKIDEGGTVFLDIEMTMAQLRKLAAQNGFKAGEINSMQAFIETHQNYLFCDDDEGPFPNSFTYDDTTSVLYVEK